jgi:pimeloyl-ACP methyl ester carboxylesterase
LTAFFLSRPDGVQLAYQWQDGHSPVVVFLSGFASDMSGTKATLLHQACEAAGQAFLRLDYSGHGQSGGDFADGTIGTWTEDAALIISEVTVNKPLLFIGSSMGGWISLLLAKRFSARLTALLLIAPAPDFSADLIEPNLQPAQREMLATQGMFHPPSAYGPPAPITQKLLDDGRNHLLLRAPIPITVPVRILHGMNDPDVPWQRSVTLAERLESENVRLIFIKDGDHRLSRDQDLQLLTQTLATLLAEDSS